MSRYRIFSEVFKQLKKPSEFQNVRWSTTVAADNKVLFDSAALANAKPFKEIPTFFKLPWIGTAWLYMPIIGRYNVNEKHSADADKHRRLGDICLEKIGSINVVTFFNVEDTHVMFKNEGPYPLRVNLLSLKAYRESRKEWYSTIGVMLLQGKEWHDLRSKTQKHLLKPRVVQDYLSPIQNVARDFIAKINDNRGSNNEVPEFLGELHKWALETVALVGLDTRLGCLDKNMTEDSDGMKMISSVQTQLYCLNKMDEVEGSIPFWKFFPTPTWRRFTKAGDTFSEIVFRYINRSVEELKKNAGNEDKEMTLLQAMIMTKGLDASGAMVTVADMLLAGINTTAHVVGFFLYNIARNPEKQELIHQEITKLLPRKEDPITTVIFNELKYLKACIKESHRLNPIVGRPTRTMDHDIVLSGYRVPAGTLLVVSMHEIGKNDKYFLNPNAFMPERWLTNDDKCHPFAFLPFGFGTRSCIGRRLAELEIIALTTEIIRNFKVTYHHEDIGMLSKFVNAPNKPLRFNFIDR